MREKKEDERKRYQRSFTGLMQRYGKKILYEDTENAEKFYRFIFKSTFFAELPIDFYKSIMAIFHRKHGNETIRENLLKILSRVALFVDK